MNEKKNVFMIMLFQDEFLEVYEMIKDKLFDEYEFSNANEKDNQKNILDDIFKPELFMME